MSKLENDRIVKLCREYTDLLPEEIEVIIDAAKSLSAFSSMFNADAFIDCLIDDNSGDSIVVAEAKPIDRESLYQKTVVGLVAPKEKEPAVYRTFQLGVPTKFMKAVTQENAHVVQTVEPIFAKDRVVGVFIVEQKTESVLTKSIPARSPLYQEDFSKLMINKDVPQLADTIEEGLLFVDNCDRVVFRNKSALDIHKRLGFLKDILGMNYRDICLVKPPLKEDKGNITVEEVRLGDYFLNVKTVFVNREDISYIVTISDITQRKIQEKALILKSVAFKEMHHRVKNNLQTIAALLRLQRNTSENQETKKALNDTVTRLLAISSTHQLLVESDLEEVSLNDIVANVKENTLQYYDYENSDFNLEIETYGGDFDIAFEKANAVALILNELMQNSIKHAFTGKSSGKIVIMSFRKREEQTELIFMDDGLGFDTEKISRGTMGWTIINLMVSEKLRGHISVKSDKSGTRVKILF